mmetsp:Transcript_43276/g.92614  ORF Transcript_43276/g.92614 Transcript_43276/m.92614 type:complete len:252 (+) Transcript_43276:972-1727(+)
MTAKTGMESPKVKIAGITPTAAPRVPPATRPVAAPPRPKVVAPAAAEAAVTWQVRSNASSFALAVPFKASDFALAMAATTFLWPSARFSSTYFPKLAAWAFASSKLFFPLALAAPAAEMARALTFLVKATISFRFVYVPYPAAPAPRAPAVLPAAPPMTLPQPAPTMQPAGMERPNVKMAGTIPAAIPTAPPSTAPPMAELMPPTVAPPAAVTTVTCTAGSLAAVTALLFSSIALAFASSAFSNAGVLVEV